MPRQKSAFTKNVEPFLEFLDRWYLDLPVVSFKSLLRDFSAAETAIACIDVVNGFCKEGNLASPRVETIINPVVLLLKKAEQHGLLHYVLPQDCHPADSKEFDVYPPHCVEGTEEAKTVKEVSDLPHSYKFKVLPKVTINPALEENLQEWLELNQDVRQFIVVGDCTDICIYQLAMHLKLRAIKHNEQAEIIVPANCVDTFEIGMDAYDKKEILPHPGEFMHRVFLYHMQQNGVRIVGGIE